MYFDPRAVLQAAAAASAATFPSAAATPSPSPPPYVSPPPPHHQPGPRELCVVWQGKLQEVKPNLSNGGSAPMTLEQKQQQQSGAAASLSSSSLSSTSPHVVRLTASSLTDLYQQIYMHFPAAAHPPSPLAPQLTNSQRHLLSSEPDFLALRSGDTVLVFEGSDRNEPNLWEEEFEHTPHPSSMTYSQELIAEENRGVRHVLVYALAEFVDNSISAIRKFRVQRAAPNHMGNIRISFMEHLPSTSTGNKRTFTISIQDDGCGMDEATLKSFARMGDAPQYRNEQREPVQPDARNHFLNVNISQWGVGAKAAGFFLGDGLTVTSRQTTPQMQHVLEYKLSQKDMFRQHDELGNAFKNRLRRRAAGDRRMAAISNPAPTHPYLAHLISTEPTHPFFTRIVVTGVEEKHLARLSDVPSIARELANIYNRFLHGPMGRNAGQANADKQWLSPNIIVEHIKEQSASNGNVPFQRLFSRDLRDEKENEASIFQLRRRGHTLRFEIRLPAPAPDTHSAEQAEKGEQAFIRGELYYLPRSVDGETHPDLQLKGVGGGRGRGKGHRPASDDDDDAEPPLPVPPHKKHRVGGRAVAALAHSHSAAAAVAPAAAASAAGSVPPPSAEWVDEDGYVILTDDRAPTFDLYWHGRLIPLSHIQQLSFMKFKPEYKECLKRMKGYLFFSFPILTSCNKLTFHDRDLGHYINSKFEEKGSNGNPLAEVIPLDSNGERSSGRTRAARMETYWEDMLKQWKSLDANYVWEREHYLEAQSKKEGKQLYSQVTIHGATTGELQKLKRGELYKVWNQDAKTRAKVYWLRAKWFEKEGAIPAAAAMAAGDSRFGSSGKIWGDVMPLEAQRGVEVKPLRMVDKTISRDDLKKEYDAHSSAIMATQPHHMEVWMEPCTLLRHGDVFRRTAGWSFPGTAVAVWGHEYQGKHKPIAGEKVICTVVKHEDGEEGQRKVKRAAERIADKYRRQQLPALSDCVATTPPTAAASSSPLYRSRPSKRGSSGRVRRATPSSSHMRDVDSDSDDSEVEEQQQAPVEELVYEEKDVIFQSDARCMNVEDALLLKAGRAAGSGEEQAAASESASAGRKRKTLLGAHGFSDFEFQHHTAGHYSIIFQLPDWTERQENRIQALSRAHVPKVVAAICLTPALPQRVSVERSIGQSSLLDLSLGQPLEDRIPPPGAEKATVGFRLVDAYKNEWNASTLGGQTEVCGIRVANITVAAPYEFLEVRCNADLIWNKDKQHWQLQGLIVTAPDGADRPLQFESAASRVDVKLLLTFEPNPDYRFNPPPSAGHIQKLSQIGCSLTVRLGPGEREGCVFNEEVYDVTLENGSSLPNFSLHLEDAWRHPAQPSGDLQVTVAADVDWLPSLLRPKVFEFSPNGTIALKELPVDIPPSVFRQHCVEAEDEELVIQFKLMVNLLMFQQEEDDPDVTTVRIIDVKVKAKPGPTQLLLLDSDAFLQHFRDRYDPRWQQPLQLEGQAGQSLSSLHVAFLQESGQLMSVGDLQACLDPQRAKHIRFTLHGLEGSSSHFTLDELPPSGRIPEGLALPKIIVESMAEKEATTSSVPSDKSLLFRGNFLMQVMDAEAEEEKEKLVESKLRLAKELTDSEQAAAKAEQVEQLRARPALSSFLPASLEVPFSLRVRPGPAVRWNVTSAFRRGFKCGLTWTENVRMFLVDEFGNHADLPAGEEWAKKVQINIQQPTSGPGGEGQEGEEEDKEGEEGREGEQTQAAASSAASAVLPMEVDGDTNSTPAAAPATTAGPAAATTSSAASSPSSAPSSASLSNAIRNLRPKLNSGARLPYLTFPSAFLVAPVGTYSLSGHDDSNRFTPSVPLEIRLVPGFAHTIRAFTDVEGKQPIGYSSLDPDELQQATRPLQVQSKAKVGPIWVRFYDRGNNETTSTETVELKLLTQKDVKVKKPKEAAEEKEKEGAADNNQMETDSETPAASTQPASSAPHSSAPSPSSSDPTVTALYPYPLSFLPDSSSSDSILVKVELPSPIAVVGVNRLSAAARGRRAALAAAAGVPLDKPGDKVPGDLVHLKPFTLHINQADWVGAYLLLRAKDDKPQGQIAGPKKSVRNEIHIPLSVTPFTSAVQHMQAEAQYDESEMKQALQSSTGELEMQPQLLVPPTSSASVLSSPAAASSSSPASIPETILPPVPCGAPFPTLSVELHMDVPGGVVKGMQVATEEAGQTAPQRAESDGSLPPLEDVKPDVERVLSDSSAAASISSSADDSSLYTLPLLLPGLDVTVAHLMPGSNERQQHSHLYNQPRFDPTTKRFIFSPIRAEALDQTDPTRAPADDYSFTAAGEWVFLVRYLEKREPVASLLLPTQLERVVYLRQKVIPGPPKKLLVVQPQLTAGISVSNTERSLPPPAAAASGGLQPPFVQAIRRLADRVVLRLFDRFDQAVEFASLSEESRRALQQASWQVEGVEAVSAPSPVAPAPPVAAAPAPPVRSGPPVAARPAPPRGPPTVIDLLDDSDGEEVEVFVKSEPNASSSSSSSTSASSVAAAVSSVPLLTAPQLTLSGPFINEQESSIEFKDVSVAPSSAGDSGHYRLNFLLPPPFHRYYRASLPFFFSNNILQLQRYEAERREKEVRVQHLSREAQQKLQELVSVGSQSRQLSQEYDAYLRSVDLLKPRVRSIVTGVRAAGWTIPNEVEHTPMKLMQELQQRQAQVQQQLAARPPSVGIPIKLPSAYSTRDHPRLRLNKQHGYHGLLVELAYVTEAKLCLLLSWHLQSKLTTYVTADRQCSADRQLRSWCQKQKSGAVLDLRGVNPPSNNFERMPHESVQHRLRAEEQRRLAQIRPRLLLDCFHFRTQDAHELSTYRRLFASLFGPVVILPSVSDAAWYRELLVQNGIRCPTILVLQELKLLPANNIERFDDKAFAPKGLDHLSTHFEFRPAEDESRRQAQVMLQASQSFLEQLEPMVEEQKRLEALQHRLQYGTRSHALSVQQSELKKVVDQLQGEITRLGGAPLAQQAAATALPSVLSSASSSASPSAASSVWDARSLSLRHAQQQQEQRRAQNAQRLERQRASQPHPSASHLPPSTFDSRTSSSDRQTADCQHTRR